MISKKETRSLLPGVRRLFADVMSYADRLANAHPLVIATTPTKEKTDERGTQAPH